MTETLDRDAAVAQAIQFIKDCPYKGTAIKIELEAELSRDDYSTPGSCSDCDGAGFGYCEYCNDGEIYSEIEGYTTCPNCDGDYELRCSTCDGTGDGPGFNSNFSDEKDCEDFILEQVSNEAQKALIYRNFYNDGSVDSEFTFTLPLDKASYAIEFIQAFKTLADEIDNGLDTDGAGMHVAILNSKNGNYPRGNSLHYPYVKNFADGMQHLLPALFFLGSADYRSRDIGYRMPQVSDDKYSAINYSSDVFEYRVFETCYDRPETILDYICVIANSLQFYGPAPTVLPFFGKVGKLSFGCRGEGLERFYYSQKHLDALRLGVDVLKPAYKTYSQLKKERNFKVSVNKVKKDQVRLHYQWREEFKTVKLANKVRQKREMATLQEEINYYKRAYNHSDDEAAREMGYKDKNDLFKQRKDYAQQRFPTQVRQYLRGKEAEYFGSGTTITV